MTGPHFPQPRKRLIVCCDGTWQSSAHGNQEVPSNIAKISRSIASWYVDDQGLMAPQVVYYDAGVGTAMGWLDKTWSGGLGEGLDENVCEAYNFLVNNYSPGDEIFFFGFSRGAYTVRATAGLVCRLGICEPGAMSQFWEAYATYRALDSNADFGESVWAKKWTGPKAELFEVTSKGHKKMIVKGSGHDWYANSYKDVKVKIVGVFDTVGSLGYPDNVWVDVSDRNKPYGFHNTDLHPQIENAFHALALDEHRRPFSPTVWSLPEGSKTNLIQCWFPGVHINIGGGSGDGVLDADKQKGDLECMSMTTFCWMVDRSSNFLLFEIDPNIMADYQKAVHSIVERVNEGRYKDGKNYGGWGAGPIADSYEGMSNTAAGSKIRTPGHYVRTHADGTHEHMQTNEFFHPVIQHAVEQVGYAPNSLEGFKREEIAPGSGKGWRWVKKYEADHPGWLRKNWSWARGLGVPTDQDEVTVSIPEFVIPKDGKATDGTDWMPNERILITHASNRKKIDFSINSKEELLQEAVDKEGLEFLATLDKGNEKAKGFLDWVEVPNQSTYANFRSA